MLVLKSAIPPSHTLQLQLYHIFFLVLYTICHFSPICGRMQVIPTYLSPSSELLLHLWAVFGVHDFKYLCKVVQDITDSQDAELLLKFMEVK